MTNNQVQCSYCYAWVPRDQVQVVGADAGTGDEWLWCGCETSEDPLDLPAIAPSLEVFSACLLEPRIMIDFLVRCVEGEASWREVNVMSRDGAVLGVGMCGKDAVQHVIASYVNVIGVLQEGLNNDVYR